MTQDCKNVSTQKMIHEQGREQIYHHSEMHDELEQVYGDTGTVFGDNSWHLVVLGQYIS